MPSRSASVTLEPRRTCDLANIKDPTPGFRTDAVPGQRVRTARASAKSAHRRVHVYFDRVRRFDLGDGRRTGESRVMLEPGTKRHGLRTANTHASAPPVSQAEPSGLRMSRVLLWDDKRVILILYPSLPRPLPGRAEPVGVGLMRAEAQPLEPGQRPRRLQIVCQPAAGQSTTRESATPRAGSTPAPCTRKRLVDTACVEAPTKRR